MLDRYSPREFIPELHPRLSSDTLLCCKLNDIEKLDQPNTDNVNPSYEQIDSPYPRAVARALPSIAPLRERATADLLAIAAGFVPTCNATNDAWFPLMVFFGGITAIGALLLHIKQIARGWQTLNLAFLGICLAVPFAMPLPKPNIPHDWDEWGENLFMVLFVPYALWMVVVVAFWFGGRFDTRLSEQICDPWEAFRRSASRAAFAAPALLVVLRFADQANLFMPLAAAMYLIEVHVSTTKYSLTRTTARVAIWVPPAMFVPMSYWFLLGAGRGRVQALDLMALASIILVALWFHFTAQVTESAHSQV